MVTEPAWRRLVRQLASEEQGKPIAAASSPWGRDLLPSALQRLAKEKAHCRLKVSLSWQPSLWRHYPFLPPSSHIHTYRHMHRDNPPALPSRNHYTPVSGHLQSYKCHHSVVFLVLHFWASVGPSAVWRARPLETSSRCTWYPKRGSNLRATMLPFLSPEPVTLTAPPWPHSPPDLGVLHEGDIKRIHPRSCVLHQDRQK